MSARGYSTRGCGMAEMGTLFLRVRFFPRLYQMPSLAGHKLSAVTHVWAREEAIVLVLSA